jgi:hypothetical protein
MLPASDRKYVITGLTNEERYTVRVVAMNRVGSTKSSVVTKEPLAVPSMPRSLAVASHGGQRISVSWDAPSSEGDSPINKYKWELADDDSAGDPYGTFGSKRAREADPPTFDPDDGGAITADAQTGCHTVTVEAYNDDNNNVPGDVAMVTCPKAPMNFTKQVVDNVAILRWERPAGLGSSDATVTEYVVNRTGYERSRTATDVAVRGAEIPGEARMWTVGSAMTALWDTGLSHQTIYEYTIFAVTDRYDMGTNSSYYMEAGPLTAFTSTDGGLILAPPSPPTAPRSLETMDQCDQQITLSWMPPSNFGGGVDVDRNREWSHGKIVVSEAATIEKYDVQYRERGRGAWMDLSAMGTEAAVTSGLEYDETYDFRVRAKNNIGLYGPWASTMIELEEPPKPLQPTGLVVQATGPNTVELEWQAPEDSDTDPLWRTMADFDRTGDASNRLKYVIERQVNDGSWVEVHERAHLYADEFEDNRTQAWADNNAPAGLVNYRVSAEVDDCNRSPAHQKNAVEVLDPAAEFVGSVAAASAAGAATITWSPADNASSQVVIAVNATDDTDYCLEVKNSSADSHTCTGLTAGTTYVVLVIALYGQGGYTLGNVVTHTVN